MSVFAPENPLRILLVEDSPGDALLIDKALKKITNGTCHVQNAKTLAAGLRLIDDIEFSAVLLDLSLPDTTGFNGLLALQNMAPKLPIIILTAYADEAVALNAVAHGAQDYLLKDKADGNGIKRAIDFAIQRKAYEEILITRANFDPLTGLVNRSLFENRLDMALQHQKRNQANIAVLFLDLDNFKGINDTYGHAAGDSLLQQVAQRLKLSVRGYDTVARFGGDEFAIALDGLNDVHNSVSVAKKLIAEMAKPFAIAGKEMILNASIGIATCDTGRIASREDIMRHADKAMYQAKQKPGGQYCMFAEAVA